LEFGFGTEAVVIFVANFVVVCFALFVELARAMLKLIFVLSSFNEKCSLRS
jgi:hypothetical protein